MTPEGKVKAKVSAFLKSHAPDVWYFMPAGTPRGRTGIPDYIGCCNGGLFGIETKAGKGKMTALQEHEAKGIQQAEGVFFLVNEKNIEEFKKEFEEVFGLSTGSKGGM